MYLHRRWLKKNGQEGCENVEHIVLQLNATFPNKVIGICDRDYTTFSDTYTPTSNVFLTDGRDIEMMMFECSIVQDELRKLADFDITYRKSVDFARQIGYLRIANERFKLGFSFKKKLKYNILLHPRTGDAIPAELIAFEQQFIADVYGYTALQLQQHKTELATQADKLICRGHDVVDMLANYYRNKANKKMLEQILAVYYHTDSFRTTTLCADLNSWAVVYNPNLLNI